jgi:hypothetical protein
MDGQLILVEFNELSPSLMHQFMTAGELPNFQRLHRESLVFVTEAAERAPDLDPWIQWVTVHSGLDLRDHGLRHLDEGAHLEERQLWDLMSDAGLPVLVCGSMNVSYRTPINGAVIPDPWTTRIPPYPEEVRPFFRFVQRHVVDHTADRVRLGGADYVGFLRFMLGHGLSFGTVRAIGRQLAAERRHDVRWKRAALLDRIQFDVFSHYTRTIRPRFSTFFSNSTAHYQHLYWREMAPELFAIKPTAEDRARHGEAIRFGYREMDRLIGRFLELAGGGTTLVFCTAISQQPCLTYEDQGGKIGYRPRDLSLLMRFAGLPQAQAAAPVMAEEFNLYFATEDEARRAERRLLALRVAGRQALRVERTGAQLHGGCCVHHRLPDDARLEADGGPGGARFLDLFHEIAGMKSGMHHPDGMLWIRTPARRHVTHEHKVPLASVAPTILDLLSLPRPSYMKGSLLEREWRVAL